ncbi:MAG: GerMN domain-containing protein [Spirochaetales bacterium]|nr:GerMN domain-containing protein [Spirochaetales bacterium]MCF7938786.1 GerMN domain-containing protein [Spirochaetales bacterium]
MKQIEKSILAVLLILLVAVVAGAAFFLFRDTGPAPDELKEAAIEAGETWIRNNSPTFLYDGMNLELQKIEQAGSGRYKIIYRFESRHSGYGDREGKMLAQVITPHTIEVQVEKAKNARTWQITRAVTDGVFNEKTRKVDLYFMRVEEGQEEAVPRSREVQLEDSVERNALEALLAGPSQNEREQGYFSSIPGGVEIEEFDIEEGKAYVSFSAELDENVAGSATVLAIRKQVKLTLSQFETVDRVEIAVAGETEGILQP